MDEQKVITVPLSALYGLIAATWMNGVNAGVNEGYAAHEATDDEAERAVALLRLSADDPERARLQDVLEEMQDWRSPSGDNSESGGWNMAVRYLAERMGIVLEWPAPVFITRGADASSERS